MGGNSDLWSDPDNWSDTLLGDTGVPVPGSHNDVYLGRGTDNHVLLDEGAVCKDLTLSGGTFDVAGYTITADGDVSVSPDGSFETAGGSSDMQGGVIASGGDLSLWGSSDNLLSINNLNFQYDTGSTGQARWCTVQDSTRSGSGTDIDALNTCEDLTGNTGWLFTALIIPGIEYVVPDARPHYQSEENN